MLYFVARVNVKYDNATTQVALGSYVFSKTLFAGLDCHLHILKCLIIYNYPPKGRRIVVDIYRDAKLRGIYPPLFTDPEGDSCFSIYQIRWIRKTLQLLLLKLSRNEAPFFSRFAKQ